MATGYGVRDRLVKRWRALDTGLTDSQINSAVDYFVGGCRIGMTNELAGGLISSEGVADAWEPSRLTRITEAINDEIFKSRLDVGSPSSCDIEGS